MMRLKYIPLELVFWILALLALAMLNPSDSTHLSLCPLHHLGITWCPGCGLGRSIGLLMAGKWKASWEMHPLGVFALVVILIRIVELFKHIKTIRKYG